MHTGRAALHGEHVEPVTSTRGVLGLIHDRLLRRKTPQLYPIIFQYNSARNSALENSIKTKIYLSINQNPNAVRPQNGCASSEASVKAPSVPAHELHSLRGIKANRTLIPESNIQGEINQPSSVLYTSEMRAS